MIQKITPNDIVTDANWHLCHLDIATYTARFAYVSREIINYVPFLDERFFSTYPGTFVEFDLRLFSNYSIHELNPHPVNYIFHTAFCASTLLTRCINIEGTNVCISEPDVLMQLANLKRNNPSFARSPDWFKTLNTVINLHARPFQKNETVVIKPTNAANNLITDLLALNNNSKAIFMSSSLNEFLISNIKKGPEYEPYNQLLIKCLAMDSDYLSVHKIKNYTKLKRLEKPALAWHMQRDVYRQYFDNSTSINGKTLSMIDLLEQPRKVFTYLNRFFSLQMSEQQIADILLGKAFNSHSKAERIDYDKTIKDAEDSAIIQDNKSEIEHASHWAKTHLGHDSYSYFDDHYLIYD